MVMHTSRGFLMTLSVQCFVRGPFVKFVDSPYSSESELCGDAVTASFSKYVPWQATHGVTVVLTEPFFRMAD
jgi:hypothetical protein